MPLSDTQRAALCQHLSSRFPDYADRARIARDAGLVDVQLTGDAARAWVDVVDAAVQGDAVGRLLHVASQLRPGDSELAAMAAAAAEGALVVPPADDPRVWLRNTAIAGAVVVVLGIGALVGDAVLSDAVVPDAPEPSEAAETSTPVEAIATPEVVPAAVTSVVLVDTDTNPDADADADPDGPPPEAGASDLVPATGDRDDSVTEPGPVADPCAGSPDVVVGYAYAGKAHPTGRTWRVPRGLNVRADYPRRDNGWSTSARVICVLPRGSSVALRQEAIAVDGGAWWVPITGSSVTR